MCPPMVRERTQFGEGIDREVPCGDFSREIEGDQKRLGTERGRGSYLLERPDLGGIVHARRHEPLPVQVKVD
jgi:hypothetical protein